MQTESNGKLGREVGQGSGAGKGGREAGQGSGAEKLARGWEGGYCCGSNMSSVSMVTLEL